MAEQREISKVGKPADGPDVTQYCPNCGARGAWQKCKLVCINPRCGVRIILACVD